MVLGFGDPSGDDDGIGAAGLKDADIVLVGVSRTSKTPLSMYLGYLGYKGGSEPGVIQMTFLLRRKTGEWRAVAASWTNPAAAIDEGRFVALVARLVALQK